MQHLGKYEIISEIGRGAMGAVYKARDPLIDRLVALKTITGGSTAQANLLDRFYQEARSAGTLQHPNIVTIYELGHEKNTPFIAMEYLEGESLDRIIEQHPVLPLSVKLGYIVRVCEALAYAHSHNVIHRDVKPANIMVTKEGVVKVVDFGIARLTDMSMTQPNMMIGSRAYMSPQLYKGERADARSDIWAIGVTLYELLAYKRPFNGDSEAELMFHIIYENPENLKNVSQDCTDDLAPIVAMMLEKKVEDRYQSMEDVLHALEPIWKAAQQETVSGLLADCKDLVAAKDYQRAHALLRKALHIDVGNTQAKTMLEKVSIELRRTEILPRLQEHMSRGEGFLKTGRLREAKAEAEAALGLDSKHEQAHKLIAAVQAAEARAQELEQKLRLTKQRLAEGALTEAAAALGQALELDSVNPQAQELKRQIEEERNRREKRKKLSEILHRARTLWTELNYDECLALLAAALQEFPNEPELKKLQETARTDQSEQAKQRQMAEVRRLLGQQNFEQARAALEVLSRDYPQDTAVKNLQSLATQEENEQKRQKRLDTEIAALRTLLGGGKFKQVLVKGEPLLQEYPQDYELKELVNFARGEVAHQEEKKKEEERQKQIQGFLMCERYAEALDAAKKGIEEFPKQDIFRKLAAEAEALKKEQDDRERARTEMQRRVREINSKINNDKITDAIDLAQQTMETMGPDHNVTQLLQGAEAKKKKKEEQDRKVSALQTMIDKGDHAGATQLFNEVLATQILQPNDPRAQQLRGQISSLTSRPPTAGTQPNSPQTVVPKPALGSPPQGKSAAKKPAPPVDATQMAAGAAGNAPGAAFSATRMVGPPETQSTKKEKASGAATGVPMDSGQRAAYSPSAESTEPPAKSSASAASELVARVLPLLRKPPAMIAGGTLLAIVLAIALWPKHGSAGSASAKESQLRQQAEQLWQNRQFDQSEQLWQQLAKTRGVYQAEASQRVADIEQKRADEQKQFDAGMSGLAEKKDCTSAMQAFQAVVDANAWHAGEAADHLAEAKTCVNAMDVHQQEQSYFDQGVKSFQTNDLDGARKQFRAMLDLNVAGSTLKPQAENYLSKIRQSGNDQKMYDAAMQDLKDEKWVSAQDQFQELIKRKSPKSADAKKQLPAAEKALQIINSVQEAIRSGSYRTAKTQIEAAQQWTKTREALSAELRSAEQQQFENIKSNAQAAEGKGEASGIQRALDDLHGFQGRAEDSSLETASRDLDKKLTSALTAAMEKTGDKAAFETAVNHFNQAVQKKDADALNRNVMAEFQKIAKGTGIYRDQAAQYVNSTIPAEIQTIKQTSGKLALPALTCGPGQATPGTPSVSSAVNCGQLDASLQWVGIATVDFPDEPKPPAKLSLPYPLTVILTVDESGKVKVDKEGNPDKAFFNKVKDASKHWKATVPMAKGKPVTVRFPLTITFQR